MKTPLQRCPSCDHEADALTKLSGGGEWADARLRVAVCVYCAAVNILTHDAKLRAPNAEELRQALESPVLVRTVAAVARLVRERADDNARRARNN